MRSEGERSEGEGSEGGLGAAERRQRLERAWSVFTEHGNVIADVLQRFRLGIAESTALAHDFATTHLPDALPSHDPRIGPLEPWLYSVCARWVARQVAARARTGQRLAEIARVSLDDVVEPTAPDAEITPRMLARVREVLPTLGETSRRCLEHLFDAPHGDSIRALARELGWSRFTAERELYRAVAALAAALDEQELLSDRELRLWRARYEQGLSWARVARELGRTEEQARELDAALWHRIKRLLSVRRRSRPEDRT